MYVVFNSKGDKILKLKYMSKFITNSWKNSNTWANILQLQIHMGKFMSHRPRSRFKKKKNAEDALAFDNVFAIENADDAHSHLTVHLYWIMLTMHLHLIMQELTTHF